MKSTVPYKIIFPALVVTLILLFFINLSLGSVLIPIKQVFIALINGEVDKDSWKLIVLNYRLPKAITAIIVGAGLSISGLLMQTLFRNPLAGPFVLGISSGASLGVALLILGSSFLGANLTLYGLSVWGQALAASIGSFMVLLAVMAAATKVRNTMSILIIGLMFGSFTSAIISVLAYFSSANELQQFMFWSFGSLGNISWSQIIVLMVVFLFSFVMVLFILKPLNSLLLGENYAKSMGVNIKITRNVTLISTSLITGVITAFAGPIAFIGLAVPHLTKLVFTTSNHKILMPAVAISGAILMLICDSIAQLPSSEFTLPINAITSLFGAPVVIWLLLRKRKLIY
ncbi:iron ABC transporter permease [Lutibacter sp.]|uniref:FecCD family ABC transporter permease n=1 Tax=Lutibacter sp. TaxID=1925666 RepID=UPI00273422DC|nr:iron ABC transporter permease [Lutibacter sp.]MDP3313519.1 iron ABC transporter permease [Lutibacter sp.]